MCILAKAHDVLAKSRHEHSWILRTVCSARVAISSFSSSCSFANAQAVFDKFCVSNSSTFSCASPEIAAISSSNFCSILAKAQDVLARLCGPNSDILSTDCSMKASILSVIVKPSVAMDQIVLARFCALNSSIKPIDLPHRPSIRASLLFDSLAHDQMTLARFAGWNSCMCSMQAFVSVSVSSLSTYISLEQAQDNLDTSCAAICGMPSHSALAMDCSTLWSCIAMLA
mmetsp:Transcript_131610/g.421207  ORF Transcript_131610/g.421207 Transcript_131610/m.421207 type:complete len:228 (-) Transcript_131610:1206-1889(-)